MKETQAVVQEVARSPAYIPEPLRVSQMTVSQTGRLTINFSKRVLTPISTPNTRRSLETDTELSLRDFFDVYI